MESKYDYVVFDIETTGLHPDSDQICEIAAIGVKDGLPQGLFSTLVAIEGSMPEAAGRVNGITDDMLSAAWTTSASWRSTVIWCASRDLMKMGSNRARSSCLRSTWMARRRNCAVLARPTYTACRGYGGYYVSTILAL